MRIFEIRSFEEIAWETKNVSFSPKPCEAESLKCETLKSPHISELIIVSLTRIF